MYGDPRVLFKLFDMSYAAEPIPTSYIAVIGQFESGPMWEGVPIGAGETDNFIEKFGNSISWSADPLACIKALEAGANLVVHRIGHCTDIADRSTLDILAASVLIPDRGGPDTAGYVQSAAGPFTFSPAVPGRFTGTELGPFLIVLDTNDKLKLRVGVPGNWGSEQTATFTAGTRTAQQVCDEINAQTTGVNATVVDNKVRCEAVDANQDVEVLTVTNNAYSALGVSVAVYSHAAGTNHLVLSVDAGADQDFTLAAAHAESGQFSLTSAEAAAQIAATITGATVSGLAGKVKITSSTTGDTSSVQVKSTGTANAAFGFDTDLHSGTEGAAKNPWRYRLKGPGAYGNGAKVFVYDAPLNPGEAINVRITVPGKKEEYFPNLVRDPANARYWKAYINSHSDHGEIVDVEAPNAAPNDWPALTQTGYVLAGGDDGTLVLTDADWVGDASGRTGLHVTDHWQMPFIDIMLFGTSSAVVRAELEVFIASRKGRFGWSPTPPGINASDTVSWRMGDPEKGYSHAAFNSWECAFSRGRFEVFDAKNNEKVEIPALAFLAGSLCKTDQNHGRHVSPFGVKRGQALGVLGIDDNPAENSGDADLLAEYQINNARIFRTDITTRGWEGAYNWGGWTSQRAFSALREVPVARKIKEYEWMLYPVGLSFINDPNHPITWREVYRILNPIFRHDLNAGAIYGYMLVCDQDAFFTAEGELKGAVLNTGPTIDQGVYRCRILIQPVRQIFYFVFEMGVMRTGEPFTNYAYMFSLPGWAK